MKNKPNNLIRFFSNKRIYILAILGIGFYYAVFVLKISLWYPLAIGSLLGIIFGKVFCRWACPMGLMMELLMGFSGSSKATQMYQYHKLGCPIAWISGWLNKFSILKIKVNNNTCLSCGKCDNACYMATLDVKKYSLYKPQFQNPGDSFSCSKCLKCVAVCPNGSLTYKIK